MIKKNLTINYNYIKLVDYLHIFIIVHTVNASEPT